MRLRHLAVLCVLALVGCGSDDTDQPAAAAPPPPTTTAGADPQVVPPDGYTCGELRSSTYRVRQAEAILDEHKIEGAKRGPLRRRLTRALARACYPGPDYRRAAADVAADVLPE